MGEVRSTALRLCWKGLIASDDFVVMEDSTIASSSVPSMSNTLIKLRSSLIEKGIIDNDFNSREIRRIIFQL